MSLFATDVFSYAGMSRWQLWFDNPNKAAVLFASLALVALSCALTARRRWVMYSGYALFPVSCYALLHTFSRGGVLALVVGAFAVLGLRWRRMAPLAAVAVCLVLLPVGRNALGRLSKGTPGRDASVGNRIVLWQVVPRMMADAPGGWGLGNAGAAFMGWYQPVERRETYRTLVSSHLTWLVELGRTGRIAYVAGWLFVLGTCGVYCFRRRRGLPFALWLALGTASLFSSVAEAWELWVMPVTALFPVMASVRTRRHARLGGSLLVGAVVLAIGGVLSVELAGRWQSASARFHVTRDGSRGRTVLSMGGEAALPRDWIVYDATVLGGPSFGRVLRAKAGGLEGGAWGIADTLEAVPDGVCRLTVCGGGAPKKVSDLDRLRKLERVCVLSPEKPQDWLPTKVAGASPQVVCGEFSAACPSEDAPNLTVVSGVGDYIPNWPLYAFGPGVR